MIPYDKYQKYLNHLENFTKYKEKTTESFYGSYQSFKGVWLKTEENCYFFGMRLRKGLLSVLIPLLLSIGIITLLFYLTNYYLKSSEDKLWSDYFTHHEMHIIIIIAFIIFLIPGIVISATWKITRYLSINNKDILQTFTAGNTISVATNRIILFHPNRGIITQLLKRNIKVRVEMFSNEIYHDFEKRLMKIFESFF